MKSWKSINMLLAVFVMALALAACSGGNNAGSSPSAASQSAQGDNGGNSPAATAPASEEPAAEDPMADLDLGGMTIKFAAWWDATPQPTTPENQQIIENIAELEKKHNFKVQFEAVNYDQIAKTFTDSTLAGDPFAHFVRLERRWFVPTAVKKGLVLPVSDHVDVNSSEAAFGDEAAINGGTFDGKVYGMAADVGGLGMYYNRGLLSDLGLTDPHVLMEQGNWTWETFMDMAKKATVDSNNDGTPDTWGVVAKDEDLLGILVASNDSKLVDLAAGKEMLSDQKTVEAFEFYQSLFTNKVIRANEAWDDYVRFYAEGNVLFFPGANWEATRVKEQLAEKDFGYVPFPIGPQATDYRSFNAQMNMWVMPSNVENPEALLYIFKKIYDVESTEEFPGQNAYELAFNHEEDIQSAKLNRENVQVFDHKAVPNYPDFGIMDDLRKNNVPPATVVETYKGQVQAAIDELLSE
ncbi:ABC transporter substrate-binding protein [Cohnella hongkongensis]|uniref:ABC transporter substrate-binding protein n=1 Tax=Cohnella hongkongensis TaxID=178337 RepID=A0ABV9FJ60_9BACL